MGKRRKNREQTTGFEEWGGYMAMKKMKLQEQFSEEASKIGEKKSDLFKGISIFVNGYTDPPADEIRRLMMQNGGVYHHYYRPGITTYVIASNLPDSKLKQTHGITFLKPSWITDCIKYNNVLDFREYLLYTNQSKSQPSLKYFSEKSDKASDTKQHITKTASDKEFLSDFYNNSRLHHISSMGVLFKEYVNKLRSNKDHKFSGREELLSNSKIKPDLLDDSLESHSKVVMHIDMDCFFVSVGIRNHPELKGVPVAVTHAKGNRSQPRESMKEIELYKKKYGIVSSENDCSSAHWTEMNAMDSMSEVASCSYEARAVGVKNGMFLGQALKLCPNLKPIPYNFEDYKEVSYALYDTVSRYTLDIEAVSCDEMYVDCTEILSLLNFTPFEFASLLRKEIKEKTRCPCSVGFGANRLQARIATKKAKPDGQYYLDSNVEDFFKTIEVSDLPGVGYSTSYKLKSLGVKNCGDLQCIPLKKLQADFGFKIGETLYKYCRGIDDKELVYHQVRKSVSAEVNYGIRFQNESERDVFLKQLSKEVSERVNNVKMKGKSITLKIMVRSKDAPEETAKFLGHGICDYVTKSSLLVNATSDENVIYKEVLQIINKLKLDSKDLRGIGIQLTRLEKSNGNSDSGLLKFLKKAEDDKDEKMRKNDLANNCNALPGSSKQILNENSSKKNIKKKFNSKNLLNLSLSQVDQSFLSAVPDDIREEIIKCLTKNSKIKIDEFSDDTNEGKNVPSPSCLSDSQDSINGNLGDFEGINNDSVKSFVTPGELRNLLKEWIENETSPLVRDVTFINHYLQELVLKYCLEELCLIIKYFYKYIQRYSKSEEWKQAYSSILKDVQMKMLRVFRGELALEEEYLKF